MLFVKENGLPFQLLKFMDINKLEYCTIPMLRITNISLIWDRALDIVDNLEEIG